LEFGRWKLRWHKCGKWDERAKGGEMEEDLKIRLLGDLEVIRNGKRQVLPASKKTRALLGYLATNEKEYLRESLCTLLWEGPDDPRAALRWSLTKLRPLLDGEKITRLRADRDRVAFEPQGAEVDLHEIHGMLGREVASAPTKILCKVVPKFRGIFLEGLDLAGAYPWNEWLRGQREATRSLLTTVRTALVQRNWETQPEEALVHARALLALDPLTESTHIQVIRLLGILGRNKEAKEEYARCRLILQTEFGAQPSAELEATRMALGSQRRPPQTMVVVPSKLPEKVKKVRASTPPLVGRIAEKNVLGERIASAVKGSVPKVILLVGEPGIGKTRLIEDLQGKVVTMGGLTLVGRSFEAEMVRPYGAWLDALGAFLAPTALHAEIPPLLMDSGASVAIDRPRLFEAMAHYFDRCITEGGWLTIILDDIQWLDDGSVGLFHFLIRALAGKPVLFACAARPGELGDNPAALRLIRALAREQRLLQINLEPLTLDQTAELARFVDPDSDVGRVFAECEGNPLFCIEFTNALRGGKSTVPETIEGILDERLNRMGDRARALR
jgi:DNA-binding SARP family transcriptional activator